MLFLLFPLPQESWSWDITSGRMKDVQYKSFTIKKKVSVYASVSVSPWNIRSVKCMQEKC